AAAALLPQPEVGGRARPVLQVELCGDPPVGDRGGRVDPVLADEEGRAPRGCLVRRALHGGREQRRVAAREVEAVEHAGVDVRRVERPRERERSGGGGRPVGRTAGGGGGGEEQMVGGRG